MKRLLSILAVIGFIFFAGCAKDQREKYDYDFQFITEEYNPFNYTDNGKLTGLAPEMLRAICHELRIPFGAEVLQWDEAYALALQADNAVLFSTVMNEQRKDLFKWAGPIASIDWEFYAKSENPLNITTLQDAKNVGRIGVIKDYAITQYLENEGFTNLVYVNDNVDGFNRLLNGETDLFPADNLTMEAALNQIGNAVFSVSARYKIITDLVYFAFNKNIPDGVVGDFQREIDNLKNDGSMLHFYRQFFNSSDFPGSLLIYTEPYPPLTFRNSEGEISGFGSEIVFEIMKRNRIFETVTLTHWSIGYELAQYIPNFCLFTMERTTQRDTLFQWVGPLGSNNTYFFTRQGSGVAINSLEDAKSLTSVGTVTSWFSDQYLRELGFKNLVSDSDPEVLVERLMNDEIDAFVCSEITFPDILENLGYSYSEVNPAFVLMMSDYYISFSKGTPVSTVNLWQETLEAMKLDGSYENIKKRWLP